MIDLSNIMKKIDIILSLICGLSIAFIASDFLKLYDWALFILFPVLLLIFLDLSERFFKNYKVTGQGIRHLLTGAFADAADIKIFQLLFIFFPDGAGIKAVSFLCAAVIKYLGNKYWAFEKPERGEAGKEMMRFFIVTVIGLAINVAAFSFFVRINWGIEANLWREVSVIIALVITAVWNFCGYKFLVFKK